MHSAKRRRPELNPGTAGSQGKCASPDPFVRCWQRMGCNRNASKCEVISLCEMRPYDRWPKLLGSSRLSGCQAGHGLIRAPLSAAPRRLIPCPLPPNPDSIGRFAGTVRMRIHSPSRPQATPAVGGTSEGTGWRLFVPRPRYHGPYIDDWWRKGKNINEVYGTGDGNSDTAPLIIISSISHRKFQLARNWMKNRIIRSPRPGAGFLVCV